MLGVEGRLQRSVLGCLTDGTMHRMQFRKTSDTRGTVGPSSQRYGSELSGTVELELGGVNWVFEREVKKQQNKTGSMHIDFTGTHGSSGEAIICLYCSGTAPLSEFVLIAIPKSIFDKKMRFKKQLNRGIEVKQILVSRLQSSMNELQKLVANKSYRIMGTSMRIYTYIKKGEPSTLSGGSL